MKKIILTLMCLISVQSFAAKSGSYECKVVDKISTKAYEAGPSFFILVDGPTVTISSEHMAGSCNASLKKTKSDFVIAESAMKNCGIDGVDMLVPIVMQEQYEKATLVVSANGTFDVYACKLNAMIEY